jgi:hypothetical protein
MENDEVNDVHVLVYGIPTAFGHGIAAMARNRYIIEQGELR